MQDNHSSFNDDVFSQGSGFRPRNSSASIYGDQKVNVVTSRTPVTVIRAAESKVPVVQLPGLFQRTSASMTDLTLSFDAAIRLRPQHLLKNVG